MNIGDLILRLIADGSELKPSVEKEAAKAGDAGAKTLGAKLGGALRTEGVKVFGRAASAAFAVAAVGALKLEEAAARVRAETGATAEEATAAAKAINRAAGSEQMSLDAVSEIAIRVRRDIGATGEEADALTARFAKFARVTRQDGAAAVEDFDDILDRWNLDASKSAEIQDVLIAGWQKWGGTMEGNQKALADIAPQLQAMNASWEDGAALINLFNSAGLDASGQVRALNTAIKKLKPGQGLPDLIAEITAIEDPTLRAQKAIEIFGSRGGVELANALHPGITGLDDFSLASEDVGDKVGEMADILDSTPLGRFKKFMSEAAAGVRDFGFDLGSLATTLASIGTLLVSVGGGKLLAGLGKALLLPFLGLGRKLAVGIATEFAASGIAAKIGGSLTGAVNSLPGVPALKAAGSKVGRFMGSTIGKAAALGFASVVLLVLVDELAKIVDANKDKLHQIGEEIGKQIKFGSDAQLAATAAALQAAIKETEANALAGNVFALDTLRDLVDQLVAVQDEVDRRAAVAAGAAEAALANAKAGTSEAASELVDQIPTAIEQKQHTIARAAREFLAKPIGEQLVLLGPAALRAGAAAALGLAEGLRSARTDITSALQQLREDMRNRISPKREVALRIGQLFSRALARGLKDSDPVIKAQAEGTRALIEAQLIETIKKGGEAGRKIQEELERKLKSKDPAVRAQAQRTKSLIDAALKAQPAKTPGEAITEDIAKDIRAGGGIVGKAAYNLGRDIARNLRAGLHGSGQVSTGTSGQGGGGGGAGSHGGGGGEQEFASGTSFVQKTGMARVHRGEIIVPEVQSQAIRSGNAVLSGTSASRDASITIEHLDASGHSSPQAVASAVRGVMDKVAIGLRDESLLFVGRPRR